MERQLHPSKSYSYVPFESSSLISVGSGLRKFSFFMDVSVHLVKPNLDCGLFICFQPCWLVPVSFLIKAKIIWHLPVRHPQVSGTKVDLEAREEVPVIQHTHCMMRGSCGVPEGALGQEQEGWARVSSPPLLHRIRLDMSVVSLKFPFLGYMGVWTRRLLKCLPVPKYFEYMKS